MDSPESQPSDQLKVDANTTEMFFCHQPSKASKKRSSSLVCMISFSSVFTFPGQMQLKYSNANYGIKHTALEMKAIAATIMSKVLWRVAHTETRQHY